jgi:hypothetical protein
MAWISALDSPLFIGRVGLKQHFFNFWLTGKRLKLKAYDAGVGSFVERSARRIAAA